MRTVLAVFGIAALMAVAIPAAWLVYVTRRAREVRLLTTRGVSRDARVTEKVYRVKGGIFEGITYEFDVAGRGTFRKFIAMGSREDTAYTEGGSVAIVYVPDHPRISSLKSIVDRTRVAQRGR